MLRSILSAFLVCLPIACLAGCSDDSEDKSSSSSSGGTTASTSATEDIGPECKAFFACCDEVAKDQPSAAGICDSSRKSVADAIDQGASTANYESSCKQGLASFQSGGSCK